MLTFAGILVVLSPAVLLALFGVSTLLRTPLAETVYSRCTAAAVCTGLTAALWILVAMLVTDQRQVLVGLVTGYGFQRRPTIMRVSSPVTPGSACILWEMSRIFISR